MLTFSRYLKSCTCSENNHTLKMGAGMALVSSWRKSLRSEVSINVEVSSVRVIIVLGTTEALGGTTPQGRQRSLCSYSGKWSFYYLITSYPAVIRRLSVGEGPWLTGNHRHKGERGLETPIRWTARETRRSQQDEGVNARLSPILCIAPPRPSYTLIFVVYYTLLLLCTWFYERPYCTDSEILLFLFLLTNVLM